MLTFVDGPAKGQALMCSRAPMFLRVTYAPMACTYDALDQLNDVPEVGEEVVVYVLTGKPGVIHIDFNRGGRRCGSWQQTGEYRWLNVNLPTAITHDNEAWRRWVDTVALKDHLPTWFIKKAEVQS